MKDSINKPVQEPLLTAIIFTYNHEDTIAKCIESLANQATQYPYEIHICEDCSTDGTAQICKDYAEKYPDKIKLFLQNENTYHNPPETHHVNLAYKRLNTKYFTIIEGDDYWCDENFIQMAIDTLEDNEEYYMFGGNTLIHDTKNNRNYLNLTGEWCKTLKRFDINYINAPVGEFRFVLIQSRIYRNTYQPLMQGDLLIYLYHLSFGPLYYCDKVTGVYNSTGKGIWSSLDPKTASKLCESIPYRMCQNLNFKDEEIWFRMLKEHHKKTIKVLKNIFGTKLSWKIWFFINFVPYFGLNVLDKNWIYPYPSQKIQKAG